MSMHEHTVTGPAFPIGDRSGLRLAPAVTPGR